MSLTYSEQRTKEQKLYDEIVLARVKRGIAFCEKNYGPDWMDHISVEELDLRSGATCVLGQLEAHKNEGGYCEATMRFGWETSHGPVRNGFCTSERDISEDAWDQLQACWEDMLTPKVRRMN